MVRALAPIHPGEILAEEFLAPLQLTQYRLAKDTNVPARRINEIVKGQRSISADTALRLAQYFGTSALFWLNLQARYDLEMQRDRLGSRLSAEVHVFQSISGKALPRTVSAGHVRPQRSASARKSK